MKKLVLHASTALLMALGTASGAFAASSNASQPPALQLTQTMSGSLSSAMSCHSACSRGHLQCLSSGLDYSLVRSPSEGVDRIGQNLSVRAQCASESRACHAACN